MASGEAAAIATAVSKANAQGRQEKKMESLELASVRFPSIPNELYRVSLSASSEGYVVWVESKKSKQQWQLTVDDISKHGPVGLPAEVILVFFKAKLIFYCNCFR